jgi:hypothetical protein
MMQSKLVVAGAPLGVSLRLPLLWGQHKNVCSRSADPASATTQASIKLTRRTASIGGKAKNSSTNCQKGPPGGFLCTTSALVCPQRKSPLSEGGDAMVT